MTRVRLHHIVFTTFALVGLGAAKQTMAAANTPLFRFGVIADIQLADKDNTYFEGRTRLHRQVASKLSAAVDGLLAAHQAAGSANANAASNGGLAAVVSLGDVIDGYAGEPNDAARSRADFAAVLGQLNRLDAAGARVLHASGNHDAAVPRAELAVTLGQPRGGYQSAQLAPGWRLVILDTTEVSVYGAEPNSAEAARARAWLERLKAENAPNALEWNSGVSEAQLQWLRAELAAAAAANERVVIASHHPLVAGSAPAHYLAWNADAITAAFDAFPGTVVLALSGHYHAGGAAARRGVHYVTLEGLVESPPGETAFAVLEVYANAIAIRPHGSYVTPRVLPLNDFGAPAAAAAGAAPAAVNVAVSAAPAPARAAFDKATDAALALAA